MCPQAKSTLAPLARKIDIHTHILPDHWPNWNEKFTTKGWLTIHRNSSRAQLLRDDGSVFRTIEENCWSCVKRLEECDLSAVTMQVLSTVPGIGFNYDKPAVEALEVARFLNDHIADIVARDGKTRFVGEMGSFIVFANGLGTVPMQDPQLACQELERCMRELGLSGLQIGSHVNGWNLDNPALEPFWHKVEEWDCPIFVHPWDMSSEPRRQEYWFPWLLGMPHETSISIASLIFGGVLDRHPKLRVCFAHGGGCFPVLIGRLSHGFHARPDLCQLHCSVDPRSFLSRIYVDSLVHDEEVLKLVINRFGVNNIMLGTDYPFPLGEIGQPGNLIEQATLSPDPQTDAEIKEKLLWKNAAAFFKIDLR